MPRLLPRGPACPGQSLACTSDCSCSHTGGSALPLLVTASVDEISVRHPLRLERDVVVRGQVVWTGRSALDIRMQLFQVGAELGTWRGICELVGGGVGAGVEAEQAEAVMRQVQETGGLTSRFGNNAVHRSLRAA